MLSEIAAEVIRFLSRRDLDKACAVSKWLDALIAQCCDLYPLRPVQRVELAMANHFMPEVVVDDVSRLADRPIIQQYGRSCAICRICLKPFLFGHNDDSSTIILPLHWTTLIDAVRNSAVRNIDFSGVDFSALDGDAFLVALGCRGLQSLEIQGSVVPSGIGTDDLLHASVANSMFQLSYDDNGSDLPQRVSEDVVLDFCFSTDAESGVQSLSRRSLKLTLQGSGITDMFLTKIFERLLSSSIRSPVCLLLRGAAMQRGLPAYANFLVSSGVPGTVSFYRFPSTDIENKSYYEVVFYECANHTQIESFLVRNSS